MYFNCIFLGNINDFNVNDCFDDLVSIMMDQQKHFALVLILSKYFRINNKTFLLHVFSLFIICHENFV
jgi:hypothetical protein